MQSTAKPRVPTCAVKPTMIQRSVRLPFKMSGLIDSQAHFEARALEYGVPLNFVHALRRHGIFTVGSDLGLSSTSVNLTTGRWE